jgi:hypothetical protein
MMFFTTFTQICCLIPCPIALIVFAIPPFVLVLRRRRANDVATQVAQEDQIALLLPRNKSG